VEKKKEENAIIRGRILRTIVKAEEKEKYVLIKMYNVDKSTVSIKIAHFGLIH
jgi:hypothetical protein